MDSLVEISKQVEDFCRAVLKAVKKFIEAIRPLIDWLRKLVIRSLNYPNRKVVYLALYAKKERVRQKNRNRIFNDIAKEW